MGRCKDGQTLFPRTFPATTASPKQIISNQRQLAEELDKPTIRKFENQKVQSAFTDNILVANSIKEINRLRKETNGYFVKECF